MRPSKLCTPLRASIACLTWVACLAWIAACAPKATFPPTEGTTSIEPNAVPFPELMATSIRHVHTRYAPDAPPTVNLPPGTPERVWQDVLGRIEGATIMSDAGEPAFHVTQVRIDGGRAEVDVIYPSGDLNQMVRVQLRGAPFQPWRVIADNRWRIPTPKPGPNYGMPAAPPPAR